MLQFEHPCLQTETLNCARGVYSTTISCWISQLFKAEVCWRRFLSRHPDSKPTRYLHFQVWERPCLTEQWARNPPVTIKRHTDFCSSFCVVRKWSNESPRLFCNLCLLTISKDWSPAPCLKRKKLSPSCGHLCHCSCHRLWEFFLLEISKLVWVWAPVRHLNLILPNSLSRWYVFKTANNLRKRLFPGSFWWCLHTNWT